MFCSNAVLTFQLISWVQITLGVSISPSMFKKDSIDNDVVYYLTSKGYLPSESELPKSPAKESSDTDATFILSKLTDEELVKLLNQYPKRAEYDLNDVISFTENKKPIEENEVKILPDIGRNEPQVPVFKLNHKEVELPGDGDPKYKALQNINNILNSHQIEANYDEEEDKKQMMFDVLVSQLKSLCCKKNKPKKSNKLKSLLTTFFKRLHEKKQLVKKQTPHNTIEVSKEYIFLVVNDEIKSNKISEELIQVDPDSLAKNSSVLLLGPITSPLNEVELGTVIKRISHELSKPEYIPLLKNLSEGTVASNLELNSSLVTGPQTRRYIKPHRCNHQSRLSKIYGGPKWLICTGYLNLNTPSLYDRK